MAITLVSFKIRDADGDSTSVPIYIPTASLTLAQFNEFGQEMAALIDAVIDGVIDEINLQVGIPLPGGLSTTPVANCEVEKGALFGFTANGTNYRHSIRLPAFTPGKFSGDEVNLVDTAVAAFTDGMINGLDASGTNVSPSDKYENTLTSVVSGNKSFRK